MPDKTSQGNPLPEEPKPIAMKGIPVAEQAEKLIRVRREITQTENLTRLEQIELSAREKADKILSQARSEADKLISDARNEAESIRAKARQDGDFTAKREALAKLQKLISTLENEINTVRVIRADFLNQNLEGIIDLACALAQKVIVSELTTRPEMIAQRAQELLSRMSPGSKVVLTASQDDIDVIQTYIADISGPDDMFKTSLRSDPKLKSGCLRLESDSGRIDARLLDILEELGSILKEQACHIALNPRNETQEPRDDS